MPDTYPAALESLGDHLRSRRLDLRLTQKQVAERLGVHLNSIADWERRRKRPVARYVPRIHAFLGYCPWDYRTLLPQRLRNGREALGLGQREFAAALGTSQEVARSWEKGRHRPSARFRVAIGTFYCQAAAVTLVREREDLLQSDAAL